MDVDFQITGFTNTSSVHVPIRMLAVGCWLRPPLSVVACLTHALRVVLRLFMRAVSDLSYLLLDRFLVRRLYTLALALPLAFSLNILFIVMTGPASKNNFLLLQNASLILILKYDLRSLGELGFRCWLLSLQLRKSASRACDVPLR